MFAERWILEEYERLIEKTNAQAELAEVVTCPMCSHGTLKLDDDRQVSSNQDRCSFCSLSGKLKITEKMLTLFFLIFVYKQIM